MIDIEKTIWAELMTWNNNAIIAMIKILNLAKMGFSINSGTLEESNIKKYLESLQPKITSRQNSIISELILPEYAYWVNQGRGTGKMPPKNVIDEWMSRKGIDKKYSYVIRKNIGEKGLRGTNFFNGFFGRESILFDRLNNLLAPLIEMEIITYAKMNGYK